MHAAPEQPEKPKKEVWCCGIVMRCHNIVLGCIDVMPAVCALVSCCAMVFCLPLPIALCMWWYTEGSIAGTVFGVWRHCLPTARALGCPVLALSLVSCWQESGGGALGKANPARLEPHHRPCACHGAASAMCSFSHVHAMVQQLALNVCALGNQYISRHHWMV